ncbi:MAG: hypothetical protein IBX69_15060 [Anaerolineales bacterium]|nr:hypothetical protein [Anaerolineales bacterium]
MLKLNLEKDKLLFLLILTDLVFILLHVIHVYTPLLPSSLYSLALDRGYGEFFQYTKELWILVIFFYLGIKHRKLIFVIYSVLFLYFLIDDSFEFHEQFGALLAEILNFKPLLGLRAVDFGELTVTAIFSTLLFIPIAITHIGSDKSTKLISRTIFIMVIFLTIFGVGMDMIEIIVENPTLNPILVIVEEGGEMLIMSFITWFVYGLLDRDYNQTY